MVLVDTTVWIDFFNNNTSTHVQNLIKLIDGKDDIAVCGVILTEILPGIKSDKEYKKTHQLLEPVIYLPITRDTYVSAAQIYRQIRKKGGTIRNTIDCIIAASAIENGVPLLHNDKDFDLIARHGAYQKGSLNIYT